MSANVLLGTQGWNYPAWVGPFYPVGTRSPDMLGIYARAFDTVEIDSTFYAIPAEPVVAAWRDRVSEGFLFSLKIPQQVTHEQRLVDAEPVLARFLSRAEILGDRLGPLLLQLSPEFKPNADTRRDLRGFVEGLSDQFRWAIEFRHSQWLNNETLDLLRRHNVALTLVDGRWIRRAGQCSTTPGTPRPTSATCDGWGTTGASPITPPFRSTDPASCRCGR